MALSGAAVAGLVRLKRATLQSHEPFFRFGANNIREQGHIINFGLIGSMPMVVEPDFFHRGE